MWPRIRPKSGKQKGEVTWRCKNATAGTTRQGRVLREGSHFTGIKGLRERRAWRGEGRGILCDKTHGFTEAMIPLLGGAGAGGS
jgi:hypothetical protein